MSICAHGRARGDAVGWMRAEGGRWVPPPRRSSAHLEGLHKEHPCTGNTVSETTVRSIVQIVTLGSENHAVSGARTVRGVNHRVTGRTNTHCKLTSEIRSETLGACICKQSRMTKVALPIRNSVVRAILTESEEMEQTNQREKRMIPQLPKSQPLP